MEVHATGNDWCGDFFDRFFAGILENLKGEEKGEEAAELLLQRLRPVLRRAVRAATPQQVSFSSPLCLLYISMNYVPSNLFT